MAQHIYYGDWVWRTVDGESSWGPPVIGLDFACFDLRGRLAAGSPGLVSGRGLFVYPQLLVGPPPGLVYLGERNANVLTPRKAAIRSDLALGENIVAGTVGEIVAELFLQHASPGGIGVRWGRLRGRNWKLVCNGEVWKQATYHDGSPQWQLILESLRANYQQVKVATLAGQNPPRYHLRYLQLLIEQYGIGNYEDISLDSQERPEPHGTTWTETWPTTGTDISTGQDQVWTEMESDSEVSSLAGSNRLNNVTTAASCTARCETALAGDAHYVQGVGRFITSIGATSRIGLMTRFSTDAVAGQDYYLWRYSNSASEELFRKSIDAVETDLVAQDETAPSADTNYTMKLSSPSDDTHVCSRDAVAQITHSNGDIQAYVRCGVEVRHATTDRATMDDLIAEDIAATGGDGTDFPWGAFHTQPVQTPMGVVAY